MGAYAAGGACRGASLKPQSGWSVRKVCILSDKTTLCLLVQWLMHHSQLHMHPCRLVVTGTHKRVHIQACVCRLW